MPQRVNPSRVKPKRTNLNPKLSFRERLGVRRFTKSIPPTIDGVRIIMAELNKKLADINDSRNEVRAKEYNKSGAQIIKDKEIKVKFSKMKIPAYGCHQLSKALVVALREKGISARIIREYPVNESKVLFRLNKKLYEASPFSGTVKEVTPEMREKFKKRLKIFHKNTPKLRVRGIQNYTFEQFQRELSK
ncbi:MAG TPA: hypothetical protein PKK60_04500 [archaeon]|nr:hypothetical protein [archaeon]